jgi:predicted dehydrogenase
MTAQHRRTFLQHSAAGVAGAAALSAAAYARAGGANERLQVGLIGCGGRGTHDAKLFAALPNVEIAAVCDVDASRLVAAADTFGVPAERAFSDLRRLLQGDTVQAVIVATPNHWHAPATILACDAGKHVYVEKPCSHNIREGRLMVEAARRNRCVVQHGTQVRSTSTIQAAVEALRGGAIGQVLVARAWNIQRRGGMGRVAESEPPQGFDYDTWVGPAPLVPYRAICHNGAWNWLYHFGCGDFGNDGVHDIDYARWGLGVETHPTTISALGGKYFFDDDQEFPDTQQVSFEYPGEGGVGQRRLLVYEQRLWSTSYPQNCDSGAEFYGTAGQLFVSRRGKLRIWSDGNTEVAHELPRVPQDDAAHVANFVDCVRSGDAPNAEIEIGHLSTTLCHLGNIAVRVGRQLRFDPQAENFIGDDDAQALLRRAYRDHWGTPQGV